MTQKELSYVEDAIGHVENIIKIIVLNVTKNMMLIMSSIVKEYLYALVVVQ